MGTQQMVLQQYTSLMGLRAVRQDPRQQRLWEIAVQKTLLPLLPSDKNSAILDMGCGDGALLQLLKRYGYTNLRGFDASAENIASCHAADIDNIELANLLQIEEFHPGTTWDVLIAWDVVEHMPKEAIAPMLDAARKRLTPRGRLLLQTPNMGSMFASYCRYNDVTHESGFTENSLKTLLQAAGFNTVTVLPAWRKASPVGRMRELGLLIAHRLFWLFYGNGAPKIASANLIAKALP